MITMKVTEGAGPEPADVKSTDAMEPYDPKLDLSMYKYPTLDLLKKYAETGSHIAMEEQHKNKEQIITVLNNFGVSITSIKATVGPTITLYEVTPAPGVRINKIRNLEDDIALSLSALGIRIIAPIPGKGTIGIEVPNAKPQMVSMESIINSRKFEIKTPDVTINVNPQCADLIETRIIGGVKYILICADVNVEVNGVNIHIIEE